MKISNQFGIQTSVVENAGLLLFSKWLINKNGKRKNYGECYFVIIAAIFYHLIYFNNKLWAYDRQTATLLNVVHAAESC